MIYIIKGGRCINLIWWLTGFARLLDDLVCIFTLGYFITTYGLKSAQYFIKRGRR